MSVRVQHRRKRTNHTCRRPTGPNRALKLGAKKADEDQFVQQLQSEGVSVAAAASRQDVVKNGHAAPTPSAKCTVPMESIHLRCEEKLSLVMSRDGGVQQMEVHGLLVLRISDPDVAHAHIQMRNNDAYGAQVCCVTHICTYMRTADTNTSESRQEGVAVVVEAGTQERQ